MKKIFIVLVFIAAALALSGCTEQKVCTQDAKACPDGTFVSRNPDKNCEFNDCPQIAGGDRDAHGCIGSAGYSWCEAKQKCLRSWEEPCEAATDDNAIKTEIENANYCDTNEDCALVGSKCPFGCNIYVNKNEVEKIKARVEASASTCMYKCAADNGATCVNKKCEAVAIGSSANVQPSQSCTKQDTNYNMGFSEAKAIALDSNCVAEGSLEETHFCNEITGTWWIDLDINKSGCGPACVIDVETKAAEINWRCTGLILPEP